jgi:predicted permease
MTAGVLMSFVDDVRYAARSLARRPTLLAVTAITLGVGIAANAIMFGIVDQLLLRPPAHVTDPDRVKRIYYRDMEGGSESVGSVTTYPVLPALRAGAPAFSELAAYGFKSEYSLGRGPGARNVPVQLVSGNFFRLLGVRAALGRTFIDDDDRVPDGQPVAIVSHGLWQELGGDASVVGRALLLQGKTFTIVGVAPRGFSGLDRQKIDVWLPISAFGTEALGPGWHNTTNNWWAQIIGRVRDGVAPDVAQQQATASYRRLVREWKQTFRDSTSSVILSSIISTREPTGISRESKVSLWLTGVSAIVLLIACANVANLLVARTIERRREIAVRMALGATLARLARLLLAETALLALLGAGVALGVALAGSRVVQELLLPNVVWSESVVDARVFAFTLGVAVVCMVLAGAAPAVEALGTRVSEGLKASSRQVAGGRGRLRFVLVLAQAALSVVLLVGAGLFVRSLRNVVARDVGIDRDRVFRVTMPLARFGFDSAQVEDIYRRGAERLRAMPGVAGVAVVRLTVPMGGAHANGFSVPGVERPRLELGGPYNSSVTAGFFATIGAPLVRGREFTPAEERTGARVLVVNETLAKAYWPNANPIGQCARYGADSACSEVVGVARSVLQFSLINDDRAMVYAPLQHPGARFAPPSAMLVRVGRNADAIVPSLRRELQALAPTMPFVQVRSYGELVAPQLQPWRLGAMMFAIFGALALGIAAVGLYSVMAYWVSQRTREIGVRMALGAQRSDVVRLVAAQSARAIGAGVIVGGVVSLIGSRWIADMLYETSPRDPIVYGIAAAVLAVAAVVASVVPARRSAAVDPAQAMRAE